MQGIRHLLRRQFSSAAPSGPVQRTQLYDFHVAHGGRMVPFAGWEMPVEYSDLGQIASHLHTRAASSLFDVSHMLQFTVTGKDRIKFFETLVVGDLAELKAGQAQLSLFTNEKGGIIDDTVISNHGDKLYVVSNAGCAEKDSAHIAAQLKAFQAKGGDAHVTTLRRSLLALQGPKSAGVLQKLVRDDLTKLPFMHGGNIKVQIGKEWVDCVVTRCGYTGEDGFEISVPDNLAVPLAETLLKSSEVKLAGLGARDSLRLESGLCLYGNDIDETTTPAEGALIWTIGKRRKEQGGFLGAEHVLAQLKGGKSFPPQKKRVGLVIEAGAPARSHYPVLDKTGKQVGEITSGGPSPSSKLNIAMAYVPNNLAALGTELFVTVRKNQRKAVVSKMPFVEHQYYRGAK